jgi:hypothetical protein
MSWWTFRMALKDPAIAVPFWAINALTTTLTGLSFAGFLPNMII